MATAFVFRYSNSFKENRVWLRRLDRSHGGINPVTCRQPLHAEPFRCGFFSPDQSHYKGSEPFALAPCACIAAPDLRKRWPRLAARTDKGDLHQDGTSWPRTIRPGAENRHSRSFLGSRRRARERGRASGCRRPARMPEWRSATRSGSSHAGAATSPQAGVLGASEVLFAPRAATVPPVPGPPAGRGVCWWPTRVTRRPSMSVRRTMGAGLRALPDVR